MPRQHGGVVHRGKLIGKERCRCEVLLATSGIRKCTLAAVSQAFGNDRFRGGIEALIGRSMEARKRKRPASGLENETDPFSGSR